MKFAWLKAALGIDSSHIDWEHLHDQVITDMDLLNDALLHIKSPKRFEVDHTVQSFAIYLSENGNSNEKPEISAEPDELLGGVGLIAKYAAGPRPAGFTIPNIKPKDVPGKIRTHILHSLSHDEIAAIRTEKLSHRVLQEYECDI